MEITLVKQLDEYSEVFQVRVDGQQFEFAGCYYASLSDLYGWQFGVCPICGNVTGRTSIGAKDYCFCLEHKEAWLTGINSFGDHKEQWYTEEVKRKNATFLEKVFHLNTEEQL